MNRSIVAAILLFLAIGLGIGGLAWYKKKQFDAMAHGGPAYEPSEAVDIIEPSQAPWQPTADLVGTVIAIRSVRVSNELAGVVTQVGFQSGAVIEKGQTLLVIDDTTDRADLEAAKAAVRVAEANLAATEPRIKFAQRMVERIKSLEGKAMAEADRDRAESDLAVAIADRGRWNAEIEQAKSRIAQVEARLVKFKIVAPFKARAGMRMIHEGQYLAQGADVVMLQEVTDQIYLDFPIPQEYAPRVKPGMTVMAESKLLGAEPTKVEVVAMDATVNSETRNIRVRCVVDNRKGALAPGMFVQVRVPTEEAKPYQMVPTSAVRRSSYGESVFLVEADKDGKLRAKERFVKLGPSAGDKVIILEGLKGGEKLAGAGAFKLRNGGLVTPPQPAQPASPQTGATTQPSNGKTSATSNEPVQTASK